MTPSANSSARRGRRSNGPDGDAEGQALSILGELKTWLIGDDYDEQSRRNSLNGRVSRIENELSALSESVRSLERQDKDIEKRVLNLTREAKEMHGAMDLMRSRLQTPPAEQAHTAMVLSKDNRKTLRWLIYVAGALGSFVAYFISKLVGE